MHNTRNTYDAKVLEKTNRPLSKRLQSLINDPVALAKYLDCSVQAVNQYKQGSSFPKTENLLKIADYYHISVDYLVGITDVPNRDTNLQSINMLTGLSVDAICKLNSIKDNNASFSDIISILIEDSNFEYFISLVQFILEHNHEENLIEIDMQGTPMKIYDINLIKALFQTRIIENLDNISKEYNAIKSEGGADNG